jgi:hypothetical protein
MAITIIITESQKRRLLSEGGGGGNFSDVVKRNYDLVKDIISKSSSQIGLNLEFLLTWGASIGGFVGPLNDFIANQNPEFSDLDISLILTGIIASYYIDNKSLVNKITTIIKEKGLTESFKKYLRKSRELKKVFVEFIGSLGITLHKVTNILSYTFILPLLPMLYDMAKTGADSKDIKELVTRLTGFGVLTVSGIVLKELITKVVRRFKGK